MLQQISGRFLFGFVVSACFAACTSAHALERVTYTSGMQDTFAHHEVLGDTIRFYKSADDQSFQDVKSTRIIAIDTEPDPQPAPQPIAETKPTLNASTESSATPTMAELKTMLAEAGDVHNVDPDLLASVAKIESGFHCDARSKAGARGLMQLMPGTAKLLGVKDVTHADDNIKGGAAYLDQLLKQYHDDLPLTLAAYNAGPAAVSKYHGIPPYRETQWYVVRVIREYNRRVKDREANTMVASR